VLKDAGKWQFKQCSKRFDRIFLHQGIEQQRVGYWWQRRCNLLWGLLFSSLFFGKIWKTNIKNFFENNQEL
jgi:hypothetical protein